MSNAKTKTGMFAKIKALFANDEPKTVKAPPVTIVEYVQPEPSEEEKLQAFLSEEETILLGEDKRHVLVNEAVTKEALQAAKIAAAVAKLKSDSAARVAKAKLLANDAVAKAEKAVLEDLVETQKLADRVADYVAEEQLQADRLAAVHARRIYNMDIVAAHMAGDTDRAEQARQAAILLAGRNTTAPTGGKSYTSNVGSNSSTTEKKEPKWPVALAALQAAGFSEKQAKRIVDSSKTEASVTGYVEAIIAKDPKRAAEVEVIAGVMCDPAVDYYAKNWKKYLVAPGAATSSTADPVTSVTATIFAAPDAGKAAPKPTVKQDDPVGGSSN